MRAATAVVALLAVTLPLAGCAAVRSSGASATRATPGQAAGVEVFPVAERQRAPVLTGTTLAGRRFSTASRLGDGVVAVNVWASWCEPCRREMPVLARADGTGLRMVGVDERDRDSAARSFARASGATYPSLVDHDGTVLHRLRMLPQMGVPSTVFIDPEGRVAARVVGPIDESGLHRLLTRIGAAP